MVASTDRDGTETTPRLHAQPTDIASHSLEFALSEAIEQQKATAEILRVIRSSPTDAQPVFEMIVRSAVRLCNSMFANVFRYDGQLLHYVASHNVHSEYQEMLKSRYPMRPDHSQISGRVVLSAGIVRLEDALADAAYDQRFPRAMGWRRMLGVPHLSEGLPVGAIVVGWAEAGPVPPSQETLLMTFADQAAIAIEITRQAESLEELNRTLEERVATQVAELDRMGRLRRFLPKQLAEVVINSNDTTLLDSHRREISVVFCDLRGFTAFAEIVEPEEVMSVLSGYHAAAGSLIEKYEGTLERYLGDGIMVLFNDPLPCPDPAHRAVRLGVELREAIDELRLKWSGQGYQLGFGVGIAYGFATLGKIGFEGRHDYTAIGTVVNQASRLCSEAKPGEILVTQRVASKVSEIADVEPIGELALKGLRQLMASFRLLSLKQ